MSTLAIQAHLRAGLGDRAPRVGPFLITLDEHTDNPYRNYAIPDEGAAPNTADIAELVSQFARRNRMPRLEFVSPAAGLEAALAAAGFTVDGRLPLMVLDPAALSTPDTPAGVDVAEADTEADLRRAATVPNVAYGEASTTEADVARLRRTVAAGGRVVLAVHSGTGAALGAGLHTPPRAGMTEIAAIGVLPAFRRRGIATALCGELTRAAFAAGVTPFLQTGAEPERRAYARVGYRVVGDLSVLSCRVLPAQPIPGPRLVLLPVRPPAARRIVAGDLTGALAEVSAVAAVGSVTRLVPGRGWPQPGTRDGMRMVAEHGASAWLVVDQSGAVVGDAGTHGPVDPSGQVEIGYGLAAPYRGRGYGSEVVGGLSRWLLGQPAVRRVLATTGADNTPSRRSLERAGFALADTERAEPTGDTPCRYVLPAPAPDTTRTDPAQPGVGPR